MASLAEIGEPFDPGQVGSSTMAHKRNPITFENLEGMWFKTKSEFGKVLDTMISEHQRDLVGSSLMRDFPTIVVNLVTQLTTLLRQKGGQPFIARLTIDTAACGRNLQMQGDIILAEPMYLALQMAGYEGDAHELVNHTALPYAQQHQTSLVEATKWALEKRHTLTLAQSVWEKIPPETVELLTAPERYTGAASAKAHQIARIAQAYLDEQS